MASKAPSDSADMDIVQAPYKRKMREVLGRGMRFPTSASQVLPHLYLGSESDATSPHQLKKLGITHIVNCAAGYMNTGPKFYGSDFTYMGFEAEDDWSYDIMQHFPKTYDFIEMARKKGGKVLIHCLMGVNRSGALATAYVMVHQDIGLITATRRVKEARHMVLTNENFQSQLVAFAYKNGYLLRDQDQLEPSLVTKPKLHL